MPDPLVLDSIVIASADPSLKPLVTLSVRVEPGEIVTIMGPSGAGKSSLLSYVLGVLPKGLQGSGTVTLGAQTLTTRPTETRGIGILFQDHMLFPHLSVAGNLAFGLRSGMTRTARRDSVEQALEEIGLSGFATRDPAALSGGQRARVALMRVLLSEPRALLLDEPFSRLDASLRHRVRAMVFDRIRARALPTLMVTHDAEDAAAAGGRIIEIDGLS